MSTVLSAIMHLLQHYNISIKCTIPEENRYV
uniref:Uncharacterized protein n=1 Tax=Myoviridae sp. ctYA416 TaxID=2825125 RepID=A0A8S5UTP8_9CAUD|nr:MAG TPA: hypothetical protein [Myoviridae sp. ctYA416]